MGEGQASSRGSSDLGCPFLVGCSSPEEALSHPSKMVRNPVLANDMQELFQGEEDHQNRHGCYCLLSSAGINTITQSNLGQKEITVPLKVGAGTKTEAVLTAYCP